tara:strand:+ start:882 stop:986 length:105 start_codon:yes stop_codon:yes gene_type:complete
LRADGVSEKKSIRFILIKIPISKKIIGIVRRVYD